MASLPVNPTVEEPVVHPEAQQRALTMNKSGPNLMCSFTQKIKSRFYFRFHKFYFPIHSKYSKTTRVSPFLTKEKILPTKSGFTTGYTTLMAAKLKSDQALSVKFNRNRHDHVSVNSYLVVVGELDCFRRTLLLIFRGCSLHAWKQNGECRKVEQGAEKSLI